ncbi:MAG: S8 family serine peptidase, partial [Nanoarchaeota archaeon]
MKNIRTAKKSAIFLLGVLLVLLAVSFVPFGNNGSDEKAGAAEKTILMKQLQELNSLPPAVDEKIEPEVKEQVREALYFAAAAVDKREREEKEKVVVVVEATADVGVGTAIKDVGGTVIKKTASVDKATEIAAVEVTAGRLAEMASSEKVIRIYPRVTYYPTLDESVPLMKAGAFWNSGYTGNGTKVAVLDTGIDKNHPMLQGKVVAEKDFSKSGNTDDKYGHGTHVAGIIAGTTANGGKYSGVAPNAQLLNAKVIGDDGTGDNVDIIAGIGWALDPDSNPSTDDGAKVISMSLGAPKALDTSIDSAIKDAVAKGAVVVVSSGNCGSGCPSVKCGSFRGVTSPGNSPSVISVGAVDKSKSVACFSSGESISGVGIKPDFVAPGVGVKSSVPGGSYQAMDGTSMAAPHVSGAIALMLSKNSALKQEDVKSVLEKTSLDLG